MRTYTEDSTGKLYKHVGYASYIDHMQDKVMSVIYCPVDDEFNLSVRAVKDFEEKFTLKDRV